MSRRVSTLELAGQTREMKYRRGHPDYKIEVVWVDGDTEEDHVSTVTVHLSSYLDDDVRIENRGDITNDRVVQAVEEILCDYAGPGFELRSFEVFERETLRRSSSDMVVDD